jgi:hypothetical protein
MLPSPRSQPSICGGPLRVLDGQLVDELREPVVTLAAGLVEGVGADEVADREQEQLGADVAEVAGAALVVRYAAPRSTARAN